MGGKMIDYIDWETYKKVEAYCNCRLDQKLCDEFCNEYCEEALKIRNGE